MEVEILPDGSVLCRAWTAELMAALEDWRRASETEEEATRLDEAGDRRDSSKLRTARAMLAGMRARFLALLSQEMTKQAEWH